MTFYVPMRMICHSGLAESAGVPARGTAYRGRCILVKHSGHHGIPDQRHYVNFDMYFFPPVDAKASADTGFRTVQTSGLNNFGGTVELMEENYHIVNEMR